MTNKHWRGAHIFREINRVYKGATSVGHKQP